MSELHSIPGGAILIRDGIIVEVGTARRVENLADARYAQEIDAWGRVVMPGFVDSHTHLAFPFEHGGEEYAAERLRTAPAQRIESRVRTHLEAMARHGTTTVEGKAGNVGAEGGESKLLRVMSSLHEGPVDVVASFLCRIPHTDDAPAVVAHVEEQLLPRIARRKTAAFADVYCNGEPSHLALYDRYLQSATALGLACKLHAGSERVTEIIDLALKYKAASIDHLEYATAADARRIGEAGMLATLFPVSCCQANSPRPPARELIDSGSPVAIATNFNAAHSPTLNMQTAITLAVLNLDMTIEEAISAATINGAHAVGREDRAGSLEPGKVADLIVLNASDYRELRENLGTNLVHQTIKSGRLIYQEGAVGARDGKLLQTDS